MRAAHQIHEAINVSGHTISQGESTNYIVRRVTVYSEPQPIRPRPRRSLAAVNERLAADPSDLARRVEANTLRLTGKTRF